MINSEIRRVKGNVTQVMVDRGNRGGKVNSETSVTVPVTE